MVSSIDAFRRSKKGEKKRMQHIVSNRTVDLTKKENEKNVIKKSRLDRIPGNLKISSTCEDKVVSKPENIMV